MLLLLLLSSLHRIRYVSFLFFFHHFQLVAYKMITAAVIGIDTQLLRLTVVNPRIEELVIEHCFASAHLMDAVADTGAT